jgi:protein involved in polysaccharide export with SLBB domain
VEVNREGKIVLPKVGVVSVAGLTYGDLKPAIERELSRYYEKINVGISLNELRTIRVFIVGEVNHPGSYPVSSLSTLFSALFAAGGPTKTGTLRNIELKRGNRVVARSDLYKFLLRGDKSQDQPLQSGDTVFVPIIGPTVGIAGNVRRPAIYEIKGSADLSELLDLAGGVLPTGSLNRVQIERIVNHDKKIVLDKSIALATKVEKLGIPLQNMDFVQVFPINQAISNMVQLEGSVKYPGPYELKEGMRIKEILPSPKELTFYAYLPKAEVIRIDKYTMQTDVIPVNLQKLYSGDETQNIKLEMGDRIVVASEIKEEAKVTIKGEVSLPGEYVIENGERLSTLIERAGGYTANAYLFGAVFTRKSVQAAQETSQREMIANLEIAVLRRENSFPFMSDEGKAEEQSNIERNKKLLDILKNKMISGRVVIKFELPENMKGTNNDIVLEDGDAIEIPKIQNTINIIGAVFQPGAQVYSSKLKASDYLNKMGGFTKYADQGAVSILRADGSTVSRQQGYNVLSAVLNPGDMIIVPERVDYVDIFTIIKEGTRWVYELAVTYGMIRLIFTNK